MQGLLENRERHLRQRSVHADDKIATNGCLIISTHNFPYPPPKKISLNGLAKAFGGDNPQAYPARGPSSVVDGQTVFEQTAALRENPLKVSG